MTKYRWILFAFVACVSCSKYENNSSSNIRSVIGTTNTIQSNIDIGERSYFHNIVSINIDNKIMATGFVSNSKENIIVTAAHVALFLVKGSTYNVDANNAYAENKRTKLKLQSVQSLDIKNDQARISFSVISGTPDFVDFEESKECEAGTEISVVSIDENFNYLKSDGAVIGKNVKAALPYIFYDVDTVPSMSGAPIIDKNGKLVGVHSSGIMGQLQYNRGTCIK